MCSLYMGIRGNVEVCSTTGKISPWAMPPWERDPAIYEQVWHELKGRVRDCLLKMEVLTAKRRHSDPEMGQAVELWKAEVAWFE